ncbi:MAG: ethanolamine ammonia lyase small subunit [Ignavibacteriae bacterium HGW-Ignavibacteriae-2]|nr:MAG: ethanolamine ammonia lyase small subunit [Ignavibacteriae bacterium HGW-Ignavibacteriae-2]
MDNQQLESLVKVVLNELENRKIIGAKASDVQSAVKNVVSQNNSDIELNDLADESIKNWIGVKSPKNSDMLKEIRKSTEARIGVGRSGTRPRTLTLLKFLADHSLSRDTVFKEVPEEWVEKTGLFIVQTQATDKDEYLTRPDLGRKLLEESRKTIIEKCKKSPTVQIVLSDGLSTDALTMNFDEILPPLVKGFESAGINVGTPFFVKYGRVKVEDEIGEILDADVVVLLIGERPGLGQSESMSSYMVYRPSVANTVESDRTVISNIHKRGTPPVEASAVIVDVVKKMIANKASGIKLANNS